MAGYDPNEARDNMGRWADTAARAAKAVGSGIVTAAPYVVAGAWGTTKAVASGAYTFVKFVGWLHGARIDGWPGQVNVTSNASQRAAGFAHAISILQKNKS